VNALGDVYSHPTVKKNITDAPLLYTPLHKHCPSA
jgi:hypothetical protein